MKILSYIPLFLLCTIVSCNETSEKIKPIAVDSAAGAKSIKVHISQPKKNIPANGYYVEKYESGEIKMEGKMKDNKREGIWKAWFKNGKMWSTAYYVSGLRQGHATVFQENGNKLYQGEYLNDKKIGVWQLYDEQGKQINDTLKK